jgi:hypothetical protein
VRKLIKDLAGQRTVLLSTHILPEVSQICERVIIVNQGRVVAEDTPSNLTGQLQKGLRTVLHVDGPPAEVQAKLESLEGVTRVATSHPGGEILVESAADDSLRPLIAKTIVESGWGLKEMRTSDLSLEEVFVQLVTGRKGLEPCAESWLCSRKITITFSSPIFYAATFIFLVVSAFFLHERDDLHHPEFSGGPEPLSCRKVEPERLCGQALFRRHGHRAAPHAASPHHAKLRRGEKNGDYRAPVHLSYFGRSRPCRKIRGRCVHFSHDARGNAPAPDPS